MATVYTKKSDITQNEIDRLKTHKDSKFFPDAKNTISEWENNQKPTEQSSNGSLSANVYSSSGNANSGSSALGDYEKKYKDQEDDAQKAMKKRKGAYENMYDTVRDNLFARRGELDNERNRAVNTIDSDLENALTRARSGREEMDEYYDDQESTLRDSYSDQKDERQRIFTARNITNSSYYIDAVTKADAEFNKVLGSLNKDEARRIADYDIQIKEISDNATNKKAEIESAYVQAQRQINEDITKTDYEKADAFDRLEQEFSQKSSALDEQLLKIQMQQQSYREKVSQYAYDKGYTNTTYGIDLSNEDLKMKTPNATQALLEALSATKGSDGYVDPDEYVRLRSISQGSPSTFDARFGNLLNPNDASKTGNSKKSGTDIQSIIDSL